MALASMLAVSCSTPEEKVEAKMENVEDAQQDLDQAKAEYTEEYNKFKLESEQKITANEKLIAELKENAKNMKKEAKIDYDKAVADLEAKNNAMKVRVEKVKDEDKDNWEAFKKEFNHDMDELGEAFKNLGKKNTK